MDDTFWQLISAMNRKQIAILRTTIVMATTHVFEASPSRRLGDKVWQRGWASGAPRPGVVWRPLNRIRRRLGLVWRRADAYKLAADAGCQFARGRAPKDRGPRGRGKSTAQKEIDCAVAARREIDCAGGKLTAREVDRPFRAGNLPCEAFTRGHD